MLDRITCRLFNFLIYINVIAALLPPFLNTLAIVWVKINEFTALALNI